MLFEQVGTSTSAVEVLNISKHGVWLWIGSEELFLPFDEFPWFQNASITDVLRVERLSETHFYWPLLDVDLSLDSIHAPDRYPLIYR